MSDHKTMNTIIHAAFRRDLARFDTALQTFPAGSQARSDQLWVAWENFATQLHQHHQDEETVFFPALQSLGFAQSTLTDLDAEHAAMAAALHAAEASMQALHTSPSAHNAAEVRGDIDELRTVMNAHLAHEERDLEPFAAEHASTPPMTNAQALVRKSHKRSAGTFFAWLLDGADPDTVAALRHEVPPVVLAIVGRVAGRRYNRHVATVWT